MNEMFRRKNGRDPVRGDVYVIDPAAIRAALERPYILLEQPKITLEYTEVGWMEIHPPITTHKINEG